MGTTGAKKTASKAAISPASGNVPEVNKAKKAMPTATKTIAVKTTVGPAAPSGATVVLTAQTAAMPGITATKAVQSEVHVSASAVSGLTDTIENSVVSRASEVMTKTNKPNSTVTPDGPVISEEVLRQMSDSDYMNTEQLAFFKARLQQLERDLLKNAGETTEHLRETVLVPDPADRATIEEEHALELRTRDRERKLLKKVQQSIASIDSGDYGWCEETGEPIGIPRLIARPTATLSLEAQQRRELKQKLYGD
jgi:DnaK suppressor protein